MHNRHEGGLIHSGAEGETHARPAGSHVEHAHVPANGQKFLGLEAHVPAHHEARLFAVAEGEAVFHLIAGIGDPTPGFVFLEALRLVVEVDFAKVVEERGDGDALARNLVSVGLIACLDLRSIVVVVNIAGRLEHVERMAAKAACLVEVEIGRTGRGEEVRLFEIVQEAFQSVAVYLAAASIEIELLVLF